MAELKLIIDGKEYKYNQNENITIGRDLDNSIVIDHEKISAHHCELEWDRKIGLKIRDMGSLNGTKIIRNYQKLLVGRRPKTKLREDAIHYISEYVPVHNGDKIRLFSACIIQVDYMIEPTVQGEYELNLDRLKKYVKVDEPIDCKEDNKEDKKEDKKEIISKEVDKEPVDNKDLQVDIVVDETKNIIKLPATLYEEDLDDNNDNCEDDDSLMNVFNDQYYLDVLDSRGMNSVVYLATPRMWDEKEEQIVIKFLKLNNKGSDETAEILFERERQIAVALNHPHIIKTYESGIYGTQHYIKMEYCKEGNLVDYKEQMGNISEKDAVGIILQILDGLNYFHSVVVKYNDILRIECEQPELVHRDIKPQNILIRSINEDGKPHVVIGDFGLAKSSAMGGSSGITRDDSDIRATMHFAPYEQILYPSTVCAGVDIWSTFAVLFWLLTSDYPRDMSEYDNKVDLKMLKNYFASHPVRKIKDINNNISNELAMIIDDVLAADTEVKYNSVKEIERLVQRLEKFMREGE